MKLTINGQVKNINTSEKISLAQVILLLGYNPKLIVIEYNGKIIPTNKWSQQEIKNDDSLEIVTIVGGGS